MGKLQQQKNGYKFVAWSERNGKGVTTILEDWLRENNEKKEYAYLDQFTTSRLYSVAKMAQTLTLTLNPNCESHGR